MKTIKLFHGVLTALFAAFNAMMLYLFMLQLPFGFDPIVASLRYWDRLSPRIEIVSAMAVLVAVGALIWIYRAGDPMKNRVTYMRRGNPHPAASVFFTARKQPFETNTALQAFPAVKEEAFSPEVQLQVWGSLYAKHADNTLIASTRAYWRLMRDLYLLSVVFMAGYLIAWPLNAGVPFGLSSAYLFVFGAQVLFLMIGARGVGYRFVDNVVATELGIGLGQSGLEEEKKGKRRF